jgi:hypothetical protein
MANFEPDFLVQYQQQLALLSQQKRGKSGDHEETQKTPDKKSGNSTPNRTQDNWW